MTVVPLMVVPLTLVATAASVYGRVVLAALAVYGVVITAGLAWAGHSGEITIAVDPFDMRFAPFQALAWLFPDYRAWTTETWALTVAWLASAGLAMAWAYRNARRPVTDEASGAPAQPPSLGVPASHAAQTRTVSR